MADITVVSTIAISNNESVTDGIEGRLQKKGKFSSNWYDCYAKIEKDSFVYQKLGKKVKANFLSFKHVSNLSSAVWCTTM